MAMAFEFLFFILTYKTMFFFDKNFMSPLEYNLHECKSREDLMPWSVVPSASGVVPGIQKCSRNIC